MPLTDQQMKYIGLAWQCFETEPKVNMDKFHPLVGSKSAHSAYELLRTTKKKLRELSNSKSSTTTSKGGKDGLSDSRMKYLALAWQCFETEPKVNMAKFKQLTGSRSEHSAYEMLRVTKKKLKVSTDLDIQVVGEESR
jgi:hypothetical protein